MTLIAEVERLKREKNAIILVHNYQIPEVQNIADFWGDSLELAKKSVNIDARIIVFCGVRFMAETAKILSPNKTVLLPKKEASCPMADMVNKEGLLKLKKRYSDAKVVSYVNTNADVKSESDVCCTSANAIQVTKSISADRIIFIPDRNLASYCQRFVDKEIIPWDGFCYVHARIREEEVVLAKERLPDALLLVHPECVPSVVDLADEVLSTSGMLNYARKSSNKRFLIGTEEGLIYRLKRENPMKEFYTAGIARSCLQMKITTLYDVYLALKEEHYAIELPEETINSAQRALNRMLNL
ncbi:quinolinate synthase NadA [candidate division WOR-3 bacterium]|nr:quinolinate synthase NadA [candidate division WOR-3 bacterium]